MAQFLWAAIFEDLTKITQLWGSKFVTNIFLHNAYRKLQFLVLEFAVD